MDTTLSRHVVFASATPRSALSENTIQIATGLVNIKLKIVEVKKYTLPPTALVPNSPNPLLHYPGLLSRETDRTPEEVYSLLKRNKWEIQWIFRYGMTQHSHYHSQTHECMAVLTGNAIVRFGVADTVSNLEESTFGSGKEDGGIEIETHPGDVFVIPAGVAHKTYNVNPDVGFKLLTPGDGHGVETDDMMKTLSEIQLSGFTMLGAFPIEGSVWDFAMGGQNEGEYAKVWSVPKPELDPVLGKANEGVCGQWR